nr:hypothetical protein [Tanacetum cinerariifolium]
MAVYRGGKTTPTTGGGSNEFSGRMAVCEYYYYVFVRDFLPTGHDKVYQRWRRQRYYKEWHSSEEGGADKVLMINLNLVVLNSLIKKLRPQEAVGYPLEKAEAYVALRKSPAVGRLLGIDLRPHATLDIWPHMISHYNCCYDLVLFDLKFHGSGGGCGWWFAAVVGRVGLVVEAVLVSHGGG